MQLLHVMYNNNNNNNNNDNSPLFILGLHILANDLFSTWPRPYTKVKKVYTIKTIKTVKIITN